MNNETQFDAALTRALHARRLPEVSPLFAAKLQARCAVEKHEAANMPQGLQPLFAAAGSLVMGLLIGVMLFSSMDLPTASNTVATDNSSAILYHYIYKSAV